MTAREIEDHSEDVICNLVRNLFTVRKKYRTSLVSIKLYLSAGKRRTGNKAVTYENYFIILMRFYFFRRYDLLR